MRREDHVRHLIAMDVAGPHFERMAAVHPSGSHARADHLRVIRVADRLDRGIERGAPAADVDTGPAPP